MAPLEEQLDGMLRIQSIKTGRPSEGLITSANARRAAA
jgi:hypothetical protein